MSTEVSPATAWSLAFLTQLVSSGIQHLVLSPGSRSQALALAADALSQTDPTGLQVHVCIDERTAGFYGLGLAIHTGVPTVFSAHQALLLPTISRHCLKQNTPECH